MRTVKGQTQVVLDRSSAEADATSAEASEMLDAVCTRFNVPEPAHVNASLADETRQQYSAALTTDFCEGSESERTRVVLQKNTGQNVVVRRSSAIISDFDKSFWVNAFVELFPFGRGGFDEPRSVGIALGPFIGYCLRLSSRRHAEHHSFTLVAFDVLVRHESMNAVYLRAKMSPATVSTAASVGRAELVQHLESQEARLKRLATSRCTDLRPQTDPHIRNLYSFITTGMSAFYGSNEERVRARSDLLVMQLVYGQPSIFFTMSPSCASSYRVAAFAGKLDAAVLDLVNEELRGLLIMSKARLGEIAAKNPMACAR